MLERVTVSGARSPNEARGPSCKISVLPAVPALPDAKNKIPSESLGWNTIQMCSTISDRSWSSLTSLLEVRLSGYERVVTPGALPARERICHRRAVIRKNHEDNILSEANCAVLGHRSSVRKYLWADKL